MIHGQNTNTMTKHVGVYNDKKCVIVIQLPEATNEVHIVDTESLPDLYHQNLMEIVTSPEGQAAQWLGEVMSRKMLYDGSNALRTFYERNYIIRVASQTVQLAPLPNNLIPFTQVYPMSMDPIAAQQNPAGTQDNMYAHLAAQEQVKLDAQMEQVGQDPAAGHNQHAQNLAGDVTSQQHVMSNNLLAEAQMLEAEAANKRAQAAAYGNVAPKPGVTPVMDSVDMSEVLNPHQTSTANVNPFVDSVTGKSYKTAGALKGVQTKRANAAKG